MFRFPQESLMVDLQAAGRRALPERALGCASCLPGAGVGRGQSPIFLPTFCLCLLFPPSELESDTVISLLSKAALSRGHCFYE